MDDAKNDKRKFLRLPINLKAKCKFLGPDERQFKLISRVAVEVETQNLSLGGCCITCEGGINICAAQEDSLVKLEISFVDNETMKLTGRVMWVEKVGVGIRTGLLFEHVSEEDRKKILNYLNEELRFNRE